MIRPYFVLNLNDL